MRKEEKTKNNHVLNRYKVIDDWSTFMSGFSLSMLKVSKMNSLVGSSYKLIHSDFMRIKEMLAKNGYPRTFVDNCIRGFLNSKHTDTKRTNQITTQPTQKHLTCRIPFLGPISMQVQHEIGNYFAKNTNGKIKVRVIHDTFKLKSFFRVKEGQALLHRSNVVYHIHCSCGSNYIGETARNLLTRLNEHNPGSKKCKNTDVTNHLYENSDHKIDFAKPKILGTARNRTKLFILETLSIDKLKPDINVDQSSITLYLFNTWLFFVFSSFLIHCTTLVSQNYLVCLAVEQQIVYISRFYSIAALCITFTEMCLLSFETSSLLFYCFRFYFLLMMDIAKSETFKNFIILNKALLFLIKFESKTIIWSSIQFLYNFKSFWSNTEKVNSKNLPLF